MFTLTTIPYWLPNALTVFRLITLPVIIFFVLSQYWLASFLLGFLSCVTDFFDGYLARSYNLQSQFGKTLDPLADKLFTVSSFFAIAFITHPVYQLPLWFAIFELCKELARIALNAVCMRILGEVIPSGYLGKLSTAIKMFFLGWLTLGYYFELPASILFPVSSCIIVSIMILELWSLSGYFAQAYKKITAHR